MIPNFIVVDGVNTTLADAVSTTSTTITLASSANLPTLGSGQSMPLILQSASNASANEVVYVTAISGASLTVERGQEGTSAQNFAVGDLAFCGPTAGTVPLLGIQTLQPTGSISITPSYMTTIVQPNITAAATITIEPGTVVGQRVRVYGGADAVTVQPNVTSGRPSFGFPDGSFIFSWVIPAGAYSEYIEHVWDGVNWRSSTSDNGINVLMFGADPTGATDSTSAIQAAINAANNTSIQGTYGPETNKSVFFPAGVYLVSSGITVPGRVSLVAEKGSGATLTTSMASGNLLTFADNSPSQGDNSKLFNKAMVGPWKIVNTDSTNTASALFLGGATSTGGAFSQTELDTVTIDGFFYGYTVGFNAYLFTFVNCNFYNFGSGGHVNVVANVSNSGEKITYIGCVIFNGNGPAFLPSANLEFVCLGCSFDYNQPGAGNGQLISNQNASISCVYHFSGCHFEWGQSGSLLVQTVGSDTITIDNSTIAFNGTTAADGLIYLGDAAPRFTMRNCEYSCVTPLPYLFSYNASGNATGLLNVDDPVTVIPQSFFTNVFKNALPSGVTYMTQRVVPPATEANQAVQLAQVSGVAPVQLDGSVGTAANTTYTVSATFTAPCNGWVAASAMFNTNSSSDTTAGTSLYLYINGTNTMSDTPEGATSWNLYGSLAVTSGDAITVTAQYNVGTTALSGPLYIRGLAWFIPNP